MEVKKYRMARSWLTDPDSGNSAGQWKNFVKQRAGEWKARQGFQSGQLVQPGQPGVRQGYAEKWKTPLHREFEGQKFISVTDPTYSEGRKRVKTKEYEEFLEKARKVEKGEPEMLKMYDELKELHGRNPRVWELHADGGWGLERIKRILKKNNLSLDEPRGGLKKQILKLYKDITEMGPHRYVKMFSPEFPQYWDEVKGPNLDIVFDAFGSKKYPMTKDIYELLPDDIKKKWKTPESLKSQIGEYLNQEKLAFKHSDEMWSKGTREKAAKVIKAKGKGGVSPYKAEKLAFRKKIDPTGIIRDLVKAKTGSGQAIHHPFAKRYGESMEKLMSVDEVLNRYDDAEDALLRIDSEKARLEMDKPAGWEKDLKKWEAIENRVVKQKSIEGITLPKQPKGKNPKVVTAENPLYYDPERKGLLGRMETIVDPDTSEITYKPKGVSKKKTFAGLSDDPLTKKSFADVEVGTAERTKIKEDMLKILKKDWSFNDLDARSRILLGKKHNCIGRQEGGSIITCLKTKFEKDPQGFLARSGDVAVSSKSPNLLKWMKRGRMIAKGTGVFAAWEAAFAPAIAGWMATEGESGARMLNEIAYGVPFIGETEKDELMKYMGGDEKAYATHKIGQIYGDEKQPGELAYLQQDLQDVIDENAATRAKVPGWKSPQQLQIEELIKSKEQEGQEHLNIPEFYEGPAAAYVDEATVEEAFTQSDQALAKLAADKAARLEEYREKGYVAPEKWWEKQKYAGGGMTGIRRPDAVPPLSGPDPQGEGLSYLLNRVRKE